VILTTSWDDGHPLDLRLAELLAKYGLPATFYVPIENLERPVLPPAELRRLAEAGFEIGGHTYHHTRLLNVSLADAKEEIVMGKAALEDLLGRPVSSFSYVGGQVSPALAWLVEGAGFSGARTTVRFRLWRPTPSQRFQMPTTVLARTLTLRDEAIQLIYTGNLAALPVLLHAGSTCFVEVVRSTLQPALSGNGVWHLWGHSWEVEKFGAWHDLEAALAMLAETIGAARWLTNGQLFAESAGATLERGRGVSG
jgi:peptidoglycan/xylan/chitin deacetylase (PgdA/CDA1 family)